MFVRDRTSSPAVTVRTNTPFQDALKLMGDRQFRRLPVVNKKGKLAGGEAGLRLTLEVPERRGVLSMLSSAIFDLGGSIESVGSFYGEEAGERRLAVKVRDVSKSQLVDTLEALGDYVVDARDL